MGKVSRLTANLGIKCRWALWKALTTGSACSNVAPTVSMTKSICGSKYSHACCQNSDATKDDPHSEHQMDLRPQGGACYGARSPPPARFSSLRSPKNTTIHPLEYAKTD